MDDHPWTLDRLVALARRMRAAQRDYYRKRRKAAPAEAQRLLVEALELEGQMDDALKAIDSALPLFDRIPEAGE